MEGFFVTQSLLCSQHTTFLLPTLSKALPYIDQLWSCPSRAPWDLTKTQSIPICPSPWAGQGTSPLQNQALLTQVFSPSTFPTDWLQLDAHWSTTPEAAPNPHPFPAAPCLPSDQDLWGCGCKRSPKAFAAMPQAAQKQQSALCMPDPRWRDLSRTLAQTAGSGVAPKETAWWTCASLTMGFHLAGTDLSVEIKYETVVASIVCILGGALKEQKERNWDTGPDMFQLSVTTSSLLHWM